MNGRTKLGRFFRSRLLPALLIGAMLVSTSAPAAIAEAPQDYAVAGGRFFPETGGGDGRGYSVTDTEDIAFWSTLREIGGVEHIGQPISHRWTVAGVTYQAFQRAVMQSIDGGSVTFLNIYDELARAGFNAWLEATHGVPPTTPNPGDSPGGIAELNAEQIALLDDAGAIRQAWFAQPRWLDLYGLPVVGVNRFGVRVLRAQRAVFFEWSVDTSVNPVGRVLLADAGKHFMQAGMIPADAMTPEAARTPAGSTGTIAFVSDRGGQWDLNVMAPDGSDIRRITDLGLVYGRPSWSSDGSKLAFGAMVNGSYEVFIADADGGGLVQLTDQPGIDWEPWLSPDGSQVLYVSDREGGQFALYLMNSDGSDSRRISNIAGSYCYPAWSPDGQMVLYELSGVLGVMRVDGRPIDGVLQKQLGPGTDPVWSPDGSQIAFARYVDDNFEVFIADANGGNELRLTKNPAADVNPTWSPDGTTIAFASFRDANWEIYTILADGSDLGRVTDDPATDFLPTWGA